MRSTLLFEKTRRRHVAQREFLRKRSILIEIVNFVQEFDENLLKKQTE